MPIQETWVQSVGQEDSLEKGIANHFNVLAWRAAWTEEPGRLFVTGSQRFGHDEWLTLSANIGSMLRSLLVILYFIYLFIWLSHFYGTILCKTLGEIVITYVLDSLFVEYLVSSIPFLLRGQNQVQLSFSWGLLWILITTFLQSLHSGRLSMWKSLQIIRLGEMITIAKLLSLHAKHFMWFIAINPHYNPVSRYNYHSFATKKKKKKKKRSKAQRG